MADFSIFASHSRQLFVNFIAGLFFGYLITYFVLQRNSNVTAVYYNFFNLEERSTPPPQTTRFHNKPNGDKETDGKEQPREEFQEFDERSGTVLLGENAISGWMSQKIRVLCWIMTQPTNLRKKAIHVNATWVKRCDTVVYVSSEETDFPTIAGVQHEGREYLWQKSRGAFEYIYKNYIDKADWYLKVDDDTYVIMENLRKLLSEYDPEKPIFFGRKFKVRRISYFSGGAGYVLSRKAVKLLVEKAFQNTKLCKRATAVGLPEDVEIARCLRNVGAKLGDSRDGLRETFHPFVPENMLVPSSLLKKHRWYYRLNFYPVQKGPKRCCSDHTISFHYVQGEMMHWLEYMVYQLRPFGVGYHTCPSNIRRMVRPTA